MSEALCMEIMARQLEAPGAPQAHRQALACLAPWMHNLSFAARWEGAACSHQSLFHPAICIGRSHFSNQRRFCVARMCSDDDHHSPTILAGAGTKAVNTGFKRCRGHLAWLP